MIGDPISKVTSGKRDEEVSWWFHELSRGRRYRKPYKERWAANETFEDLNQWSNGKAEAGEVTKFVKGSGDQATVNKFASALRTRRAVLAYHSPRGKMTPKSSGGYEAIKVPLIGQDGLPKQDEDGNADFREIPKHVACTALFNDIISQPMFGLTNTMTRLSKAGDLSMGVLKSGYMPTFEGQVDDKARQPVTKNEDGTMNFSAYETNTVTGKLETDESGKRLISKKAKPTWESWFMDWVPSHNILVDPDCGNDEFQLRWVVEEQVRSTEDVKADPLFTNTKDLKGTSNDSYGGEEYQDDAAGKDWKKQKGDRTRLFHIWAMVEDRYIVLADGHGEKLRDVKTPPGIADNPYAFYRNNEQAAEGSFFHRPLFSDLLPVAMAYNMAVQDLQRAMDQKRKVICTDDVLDHISQEQFQNRVDMELIVLPRGLIANRPNGVKDLITAWTPPPVPQALYDNISRLELDFYEILGMPPEAMSSPKSKTATQANIMSQYAGTRVEVDRKLMGAALRLAFKKLWDSIQENMTRERAVQIIGEDGIAFTALIERDMIIGDYDLDIDVEEMAPTDSTAQNAQWVSALQALGQNYWMVSEEPLARTWLAKFNIKDENYINALVRQAQKMMEREERQLAMEEAQAASQMQQMQAQTAIAAMAQEASAQQAAQKVDPKGQAPGPSPNAPPPSSEGEAVAQIAAGQQSANMQRAS